MVIKWVTPNRAHDLTGYAAETIRRWARLGEIEARKERNGPNGIRVAVELENRDDLSGWLRDPPRPKKRT
jgi:predicted site-specific integrase-resolvase